MRKCSLKGYLVYHGYHVYGSPASKIEVKKTIWWSSDKASLDGKIWKLALEALIMGMMEKFHQLWQLLCSENVVVYRVVWNDCASQSKQSYWGESSWFEWQNDRRNASPAFYVQPVIGEAFASLLASCTKSWKHAVSKTVPTFGTKCSFCSFYCLQLHLNVPLVPEVCHVLATSVFAELSNTLLGFGGSSIICLLERPCGHWMRFSLYPPGKDRHFYISFQFLGTLNPKTDLCGPPCALPSPESS